MPKQRSPNYPATDLETAIRDTSDLYTKERRTVVDLDTAALAIGFGSLNGASRTHLAAMRQYGLIEPQKDGVRVSERALTLIIRTTDSSEYKRAVQAAAREPELFRELHETKLHASADALRHFLVASRDFTEEGARRLTAAFKSTMSFARLDDARYDEAELDEREDEPVREASSAMGPTQPQQRSGATHSATEEWTWKLTPTLTAHLTFNNANITPKALDTLVKYIDLTREALESEGPDSESGRPAAGSQTPSSLTPEAREILERVRDGGVPAFATEHLRRIAGENGVSVTTAMTPNEIIDQLRERA